MTAPDREYLLDRTAAAGDRQRVLLVSAWPGWRETEPRYVAFVERYTGVSSGGLPNRSLFTVSAEVGAIGPLVELLEARTGIVAGGADLVGRLAAALTAAVRRGDLTDALPPGTARDRVAAWFAEAGVPVETDFWMWTDTSDMV
ncbi:hypothetical protein ACFFWC_18830 [Plantactinospora siamensis]|uniref:Uncharacterized protein n=1 Tax=Plantactinospora siamensis TaxID=555372 RepID=A0ABV6P3A5_9ACTN